MMSAMSVDFGCGGCGCSCRTAAAPQACGCRPTAPLRPNVSPGQETPVFPVSPTRPTPFPAQPASPGSQNLTGLTCRQLLDLIDQASFAVDDVLLYLDTHPDDQQALAYYHQVVQMRHNALEAYHQNFGPLLADHVHSNKDWTWINGPWPWEGGCVCGDMKNACNTR